MFKWFHYVFKAFENIAAKFRNSLLLKFYPLLYFKFQVDWTRHGAGQSKIETDLDPEWVKVEYHEDRHNRDRVKHVLRIDAPTQEDLNSKFVCSARNIVGQTRKTIPIKGKTCYI